MKPLKAVLLIEDNPGDARLLREMFNERDTYDSELTHVQCMSDAEKYPSEHAVDLILLDLGLPVQFDEFANLVKIINDFWLTMVKLPQQKQTTQA